MLVDFKQLGESQFLGVDTHFWFALSLAIPIFRQVYVWLAWRSELCFGTVSSRLGSPPSVISVSQCFKIAFGNHRIWKHRVTEDTEIG